MEKVKKINTYLFKNLHWILILLSLICFIISASDYFIDDFRKFMEKVGFTILTSGVFAAILKSIQFTGIFREEIQNVMTGSAFIENRSDLLDVWRSISKVIYKKKFPKISQKLEDTILNTYFPTTSDFYFENYNVSINIEEINENFEITYTQINEYKIIMDENIESSTLKFEASITQKDDNTQIVNELLFFSENNEKIELQEDVSTQDDEKRSIYTYKLTKKDNHNIKIKFRRSYSLKNENYKLFRLNYLCHGLSVSVKYPKNIMVSFFAIGIVNNYKNSNEHFNNHITKILSDDLILPHQGFGMSFERIPD